MMKNLLIKRKIVLFYFIYLIFAHLFILSLHLDEFPIKYVFTDWLINYEGGFIRRGLLGQIIFNVSSITSFELKDIIFSIQSLGYVIYLGLIFNFLRKIELNFFWILIVFSTISFLYPISELEALGRKDIYIILCFLIFTYLNFSNLSKLIFAFLIIFLFSSLIHEISFFYLPYYLFIIYLKSSFQIQEKIKFKYILIIFLYLLFLIYLNFFISNNAEITKIVSSYDTFNLNLNIKHGAFSWLLKPLEEHLLSVFNNVSFKSIIRYLYILLINVFVIIYFIKFKYKLIIFSKEFRIIDIFLIFTFLSFPIYLLVLDWGRVTYITFNFMLILVISFQNHKLIDKNYLNTKVNSLSLKMKSFIFILVCILFAPKILMNDDFSGIPLFKTFDKIQDNINLF